MPQKYRRIVILRKDGVKAHYKVNYNKYKREHKYNKHKRAWINQEKNKGNIKVVVAITSYHKMDLDIVIEKVIGADNDLTDKQLKDQLISEAVSILLSVGQLGFAALVNDKDTVSGIERESTEEDISVTKITRFEVKGRDVLKAALTQRPKQYETKNQKKLDNEQEA